MEEVSAVVAPLYAASEGALVISIVGDREVPYRVMEQLQQELVAAGAVRVVFVARDSLPLPSPPADVPSLADQGLAIVLPEQGGAVQVDPRGILHFIVQASGLVGVRRGVSSQVQNIRPQDIEPFWRQDVAYNPNLIAAVETHPDAAYSSMIEVLDALRAANAERVSLQMLEN